MKTSIIILVQGLAIIFIGLSIYNIQKTEKDFIEITQIQSDSIRELRSDLTNFVNSNAKAICEKNGGNYWRRVNSLGDITNECWIGEKVYEQDSDGRFYSEKSEVIYLK